MRSNRETNKQRNGFDGKSRYLPTPDFLYFSMFGYAFPLSHERTALKVDISKALFGRTQTLTKVFKQMKNLKIFEKIYSHHKFRFMLLLTFWSYDSFWSVKKIGLPGITVSASRSSVGPPMARKKLRRSCHPKSSKIATFAKKRRSNWMGAPTLLGHTFGTAHSSYASPCSTGCL